MPLYEIRFLRSDDSYTRTLEQEFESDAAARSFQVQHYPQKATELWCADRRVNRRVSPAHDARIRGAYPSTWRYPGLSGVQSIERRLKRDLSYGEFQMLGEASRVIVGTLRESMAKHNVLVVAANEDVVSRADQIAAYSFHCWPTGLKWRGESHCTIWSLERDGLTILQDVARAVRSALQAAHLKLGIDDEDSRTYPANSGFSVWSKMPDPEAAPVVRDQPFHGWPGAPYICRSATRNFEFSRTMQLRAQGTLS